MTQTTITNAPIIIPPRVKKSRRGAGLFWIAVIAAIGSVGVLWAQGINPLSFWKTDPSAGMATVTVDRGDIPVYVIESGALESADNATIKCEVEALLGVVTSTIGNGNQSNPNNRTTTNASSSSSSGTSGTSTSTAAAGTTASATKVGSASGGAGSGGGGGGGGRKLGTVAGSSGAGSGGGGGASGAGSGGGGGASTGAASMSAAPSGGLAKPTIKSFDMVISPHVPLRGATATKKATTTANSSAAAGNRSGGGNRNNQSSQVTGSTRILWIAPEGKHVKPGEVVAKLDSAPFVDERRAQLIRVAQARSWVEQAERVLQATKISLDEYEYGIYPQDQMLIKQYIESCETMVTKSRADLAWSRGVLRKGLRSEIQYKADRLTAMKSDILLQEARGMKERLDKYTAPRLITNIEAKIDSVTSDLYSQQEAYKLEEDRLKRLEKMIAKCTLTAPREGIVVYANQSNGWGRVEAQIMEGATVREGQPIINLPNPKFMRVRAKINESKVAKIQRGLSAKIIADAFPDTELPGLVTEVTAIPGPANGPISDVKVYYAMVRIQGGKTEGLLPGMTAEVAFELDRKTDVTRIPLQSIRWLDGNAYAAMPGKRGMRWKKLEIGLMSPSYAEVIAGLKPGDRVVLDPESLPGPGSDRLDSASRSAKDNRG